MHQCRDEFRALRGREVTVSKVPLPCAALGSASSQMCSARPIHTESGYEKRYGRIAVTANNAQIVEAIASRGYYIGPSLLGTNLAKALRSRLLMLHRQHSLLAAQIGRGANRVSAPSVRGDAIAWLNQEALDPVEASTMVLINDLQDALNRALYIGAIGTECHYARYPRGASYASHMDRFGDNDLRVISLVFYLNSRWQDHEGGELHIQDPTGSLIQSVLPRSGTMVAFLSAQFPHAVLPATRARLSLSGWMCRRALARVDHGALDAAG